MDTAPVLSFGSLLRRHRVAAGLSQEELAEHASVSRRSISDMERGVPHRPHAETVALLADALDLAGAERVAFVEAARRLRTAPVHAVLPAPHRARGGGAPPFVGRARELALLERHLAGEGAPLLLLAGEPGIGKSRLLHAALPRATARGLAVLHGGCQRRGGQEPYAPLLGALQHGLQQREPKALEAVLRGCAWLVKLLPELAGGPIPALPSWTLPPEQERRLMGEAMVRFLANIAGRGGTVLLLDDLQWAGPDALDLLATLVRAAEVAPLRVIGTYRDTEVQPDDALSVLLADLLHARLATRRLVGPLSPPEAQQLLDVLWEERGDHEHARRAQALQRAGGVPFFLVSCAQALQQAEEEDHRTGVPWEVGHTVRQRVATLPAEARELLGVAAVGGRVVPRRLLAEAATEPEEAVLAALEAACRARLLEEHGPDEYQFAHDVIREVVEADLGAARRTMLHRRVAEALENTVRPLPLERLAYHYSQAALRDKAALYLEHAGDVARAQYANAAAETYYRGAVESLEQLGRSVDAAQIGEKWGAVLRMMGRHDGALAAFERAIAAYEAASDLESVARTLAETWLLHAERGPTTDVVQRYQAVVHQLEPRGPSPGLAALYAALAVLLHMSGRYADELSLADRAVQLAQGADDAELLAEAMNKRGNALVFMVGRVEEGMRAIEHTIHVGEEAGGMTNLAGWYAMLADACLQRGEVARSQELIARGHAIAEQQNNPLRLLNTTVSRAAIAFCTGEWSQAQTDYVWVRDTARQMEMPLRMVRAQVGLGRLFVARGEWEAASQELDEAIVIASQIDNVHELRSASLLLAERDLLAGQPATTLARLVALREHSDPQGRYIDDLPVWLAWAKAELGDLAEARALITQAITAMRADNRQVALMDGLRVQALVAMKQERWTEAGTALAEGVAVARGIGYPYAEGRLLHLRGVLHGARAGFQRIAQAGEPLQAALAIFQRLGARRDAAEVALALQALPSPAAQAVSVMPLLPRRAARQAPAPRNPARGRLAQRERHAWALEHLRTTGPLSPRSYAQALEVSVDTALRDLQALLRRGLVRAEGTTKDRRYVLSPAEVPPAPITASPLDSPPALKASDCGE
jgi:transcriptional regulator with XRE-family HTH domain/tetratricopeptide (TPR) repeat protein